MPNFDVHTIRRDFPQLDQQVYAKKLVYLDSANTSLKPKIVIDAVNEINAYESANIHRGTHFISEVATKKYENARLKTQKFINAKAIEEIVFTKGSTESINLVAHSYGRAHIAAGDEILVTEMEHHSNIVPWQILCAEKGAKLRVVPINEQGELILEEFYSLLNERTKIVAITHVSNALGSINPIKKIIAAAHAQKAVVLVDGAQAIAHLPVDVQDLDCDFYVFSSHKMYGPTGCGVLYGKKELLEEMPPYQSGGSMIANVTFAETTYAALPAKFEAGTPNISGVVGLGAAIDYLQSLPQKQVQEHEHRLLAYATQKLSDIKGLQIIGTAQEKCGVMSFIIRGIHPHDIGSIVDRCGVAIRAGHLCAQPVVKHFGLSSLARASFAFYNTEEEIDALVAALVKVVEVMRV